ncbi:hypothetical protein F8388_023966 [Cannabis sativa]|uniref:Zinc knuckle CX2CX4HX4C domain-containing protein n=1 Tax=Cannabis sativa TaxID=3483 RepID=A0A7J6HV92_CANSA|nr:hypothetical protein F8388_023966 [Cannabis sativa]KAF4399227.1 hypothetical protein G4B88_022310 [Cannabis sativa]
MVSKGFFTFKVMYDISKPICPGFLFPFEGRKLWLPYRYDCLPYMCFNCGFVGHDTRVCAEPMKFVEDGLGNQLPGYGAWLKIDEKKDYLYSQIKNPSGVFSSNFPPPGFKEKPSSTSEVIHSGGGQGINPIPEFKTGVTMEASKILASFLTILGRRFWRKERAG